MKTLLLLAMAGMVIACRSNRSERADEEQGSTAPSAPAVAAMVMGDTIPLAAPDLKSGKRLMEALAERRSSREYDPSPLTLQQISEVLWAACGVNRADGKRTAPSALARYPVTVYALFPEGVYRYEADGHRLVRVVEGDHRRAAGMQDFVYTAPLNLLYIADFGRYDAPMDRAAARMLSGQDAAGYAENVNLYAAAKGLRAITRGSVRQEELRGLLALGDDREVVLAQTVGR